LHSWLINIDLTVSAVAKLLVRFFREISFYADMSIVHSAP